MSTRIAYTKPSITELEISYAADAARSGWGEKCYDYILRFENAFKEHLNVKHSISTSSCTGALHMGLAALGIGPGDEVILADTNWIATVAPVVHLGAQPVFVDILEDTWCIDPNLAQSAITSKTKAIIAVHVYGNMCEMNRLLAIGRQYGIPVIEDAAEAIGSMAHGHRAGSMGRFGTFSFHGTKTVTTGEGGMFVTNDDELFETVLTLSNHGRSRKQSRLFWPEKVGFKYKLSNIQAALGLGQLQRIEELIMRKREILNYYKERLENRPKTRMNPEPLGNINGAWMPTLSFSPESGVTFDQLKDRFSACNIDARPFFAPLSSTPCFAPRPANINSYRIAKHSINLPSFHDISHTELDRVIDAIKDLTI